MSDDAACENCGKHGRRRGFTIAPEGWLYLEAKDNDTEEIIIVWACSHACAVLQWKEGPGKLDRSPEKPATASDAERLIGAARDRAPTGTREYLIALRTELAKWMSDVDVSLIYDSIAESYKHR